MFRYPSKNDACERENSGPHVTVVRTESQIARFNNARALFEKMSEKKSEEYKKPLTNVSINKRNQFNNICSRSFQKESSLNALQKSHSLPTTSLSSVVSNGHNISQPYYISSVAQSNIISQKENISFSSVSTNDSKLLDESTKVTNCGIFPVSNISYTQSSSAKLPCHLNSELSNIKNDNKQENDINTALNNDISCSNSSHSDNKRNNCTVVLSSERSSVREVAASFDKPVKPMKPENLTEKCISSYHQQNQRIIQRHKNWFQMFNKNKSPSSSPTKQCRPPVNTISSQPLKTLENLKDSSNFTEENSSNKPVSTTTLSNNSIAADKILDSTRSKRLIDTDETLTQPCCWSSMQYDFNNAHSYSKAFVSCSSVCSPSPCPAQTQSHIVNLSQPNSPSNACRSPLLSDSNENNVITKPPVSEFIQSIRNDTQEKYLEGSIKSKDNLETVGSEKAVVSSTECRLDEISNIASKDRRKLEEKAQSLSSCQRLNDLISSKPSLYSDEVSKEEEMSNSGLSEAVYIEKVPKDNNELNKRLDKKSVPFESRSDVNVDCQSNTDKVLSESYEEYVAKARKSNVVNSNDCSSTHSVDSNSDSSILIKPEDISRVILEVDHDDFTSNLRSNHSSEAYSSSREKRENENQFLNLTDGSKMSSNENSMIEGDLKSKEEIAKERQIKREKLEEEERLQREKDKMEIEKTKRRIMELKREKEEMRRNQAAQLRLLMADEQQQSVIVDHQERVISTESQSPSPTEPKFDPKNIEQETQGNHILPTDVLTPPQSTELSTCIDEAKLECANQALFLESEEKDKEEYSSSNQENNEEGSVSITEQIHYDHTVRSAQHELQPCVGAYLNRICGKRNGVSEEATSLSDDAVSSNYEPLPPPIPPHSVDPATLNEVHGTPISAIPHSPPASSAFHMPPSVSPSRSTATVDHEPETFVYNPSSFLELQDEEEGLLGEAVVECSRPPPPPYSSELDSSSSIPLLSQNDLSTLSSSQEVLVVEDGVHYFPDGHFWMEIPGLGHVDDEEEILPPQVEVHEATRVSFSLAPIQLFSTHSVTDYDRKNEDVDPVAASAEYELEKRVEKMDVFPVCIQKGERGLGLSIIGMGVGADAGVEKLGIFVKTITGGGATDQDGRIHVNDQIIEVDGESLVGVTQAFAASVLKGTAGTVNFLIGREKDPENSEVAMLIRQSLAADSEREERRRAFENSIGGAQETRSSVLDNSFSSRSDEGSPNDDSLGVTCPSDGFNNVPSPPSYPGLSNDYGVASYGDPFSQSKVVDGNPSDGVPVEAFNPDVNASQGHQRLFDSDKSLAFAQQLQEAKNRNEIYEEEIAFLRTKIDDLERELGSKMVVENGNNTERVRELEEQLETKHEAVTKYQDLLEQSQSQFVVLEKKYCKAKKIIKEYQNRERDFLHREEYHISQLEEKDALYNSLVKALKDRVIQLENDLAKMQRESGLIVRSPTSSSSSSSISALATGELQSVVVSQESNASVPSKPSLLEPLDGDLSDGDTEEASEGSKNNTVERKEMKEDLDVAVPPTELLDNSFSKAKGELAARGGLAKRQLPSLKKASSVSSVDQTVDESVSKSICEPHSEPIMKSASTTSTAAVSLAHRTMLPPNSNATNNGPPPSYYPLHQHSQGLSPLFQSPLSVQSPQPPPLYQSASSVPLSNRPPHVESFETPPPPRYQPPIARVQPVNRVDANRNNENRPTDFVSFNDRLNETSTSLDHSSSLAKRPHSGGFEGIQTSGGMSVGLISHHSGSADLSSTARVFPSDSRLKSPTYSSTSGRSYAPQQQMLDDLSPRSPSSADAVPKSPSGSFEQNFDGIPPAISRERSSVFDWTQEQVAQWLVLHGLESCVSTFVSAGVTGPRLVNIDAKDLKSFGLTSEDKNKLKKKIKELRQNLEKERKILERENKEREKLQKKAEKLAEKAERKKK